MRIEDGQPHPSTASPDFDASTYTRVDAYTLNISRTKAGKVVATGTIVTSRDGKTNTFTIPLIWQSFVPSRYGARFAYGHIVESGRHMIVSGGLGTSFAPVRLGVPPEMVHIEIGA
jgi:hypothetical protein